ncbi:MAG: cytosine deaminase [Pseudanabaenaceae cyanobacterium]
MSFTKMYGASFWLVNAHLPQVLLDQSLGKFPLVKFAQNQDGWCLGSLQIRDGKVARILPQISLIDVNEINLNTNSSNLDLNQFSSEAVLPHQILELQDNTAILDLPIVDLQRRIVLPCFIDAHTHLDKGHIWEAAPNPRGTFDDAITAVVQAHQNSQLWHYEGLYRRMEFGLQCSYAHGTQAIRTHLDCPDGITDLVLQAFTDLQNQWRDRITLQPVSLTTLAVFMEPPGRHIADRLANLGGILGGVAYMNPQLEAELENFFALAASRGMDVDLHVDENGDPDSQVLDYVARLVLRLRSRGQFTGNVVCGHCCSLAVQDPVTAAQTIQRVKEAEIGIISLPLCNLYLQDRTSVMGTPTTPFWRGVTRIHELNQAGVSVALASDNCRDPFYGFGDHDLLQVLAWGSQIAHLDRPYGSWIKTVTQTPAELLQMSHLGRFYEGMSADLVIFRGRTYSELFSRPESAREIIRHGRFIERKLPDYRDLDDLLQLN